MLLVERLFRRSRQSKLAQEHRFQVDFIKDERNDIYFFPGKMVVAGAVKTTVTIVAVRT